LAECQVICVDPSRVSEVWPHVAHFIEAAAARGDLTTYDDLKHSVFERGCLLWLAYCKQNIEAAAITDLMRSAKSKVCIVTACGGVNYQRWLPLLEKIEEFARAEGCDCVRIFGRHGWKRLLKNYTETKIVLERRLT
jgi:hypothetical protein